MSGAIFALGPCYICRELFSFNPDRVPSIRGNAICRLCMDQANAIRRESGRAELEILPGAYEPTPDA